MTRRLMFLIAAAFLLGAAGCAPGGGRSSVSLVAATGYASQFQMTARGPDGWSYAIPFDTVLWTDAKGSQHDGGKAECLPAPGTSGSVTFAAVKWSLGGRSGRSVVWISCGDR